jgi:hypothetical protein
LYITLLEAELLDVGLINMSLALLHFSCRTLCSSSLQKRSNNAIDPCRWLLQRGSLTHALCDCTAACTLYLAHSFKGGSYKGDGCYQDGS